MASVQSFFLKVVSTNIDGSTAITQSIPCKAGSSTEFCMVEVRFGFAKKEASIERRGRLNRNNTPRRAPCMPDERRSVTFRRSVFACHSDREGGRGVIL